jgi:hypothetical protein
MSVMLKQLFVFMFLISCQTCFSAEIDANPCDVHFEDPQWNLKLVKAKKVENEQFLGYFELENKTVEPNLAFLGFWRKKQFHLDDSQVRVQAKSVNGTWVDLLLNWGHNYEKRDKLVLRAKSKAIVTVNLPPQRLADLSAGEFRVLLKIPDPRYCIVSKPFVATPRRPSVTGFRSN